jgi:hypothetical protein
METGCVNDSALVDKVCSTRWFSSGGQYSANDPAGMPCETETSPYIKAGRAPLRSIYSSSPYNIVVSDVPNNDLGVAQNLRDIVKAMKMAQGTQRQQSAAFAAPTTVAFAGGVAVAAENGLPIFGVYVRMAFQVSLAIANQVQFALSAVGTFIGGGAAPTRDITIEFTETSAVFEVILLCASADAQSQLWAPRAGTLIATGAGANTTLTITGLTAGAGTATVRFLTAHSPVLADLVGAISNPRSGRVTHRR